MPRSEAAGVPGKLVQFLKSRWMWFALIVPILVLAFAAAVLIWPIDNSDGPYPRDPYRKYATPSALSALLDDASIAGDSVYLNEVKLVPGAKPDEYIAHGAGGHTILVVATGQAAPLPKRPAVANVQGVIRTLPPATVLKREWKLTRKQLDAISGEQFYVAAQRIHIDSRRSNEN